MKIFQSELFRKGIQALVITMSLAVIFHLCIVTITSIIKHDVSYLNPLDFLGLSIVFPQYRESHAAAAAGWLALTSLFFGVLYIGFHYHLYVSIIKESRVGQKLSEVTARLTPKTSKKKK